MVSRSLWKADRSGCGLLAVLMSGLVAFLAVWLVAAEAQALRCPAGWTVRGINCCRVAGGQVRCARNPTLPTAMAPLMARPAFVAPLQPIDDSDLGEQAQAERPAWRERPISDDPGLLETDDDRCTAPACNFDVMRALAENNRGSATCITELRSHACRHSVWSDLEIEDRFARILVLGAEFADAYDLDARVFPCIAAIETRVLEPLTISELHCSIPTSDQGLPQIIRSTYRWLHQGLDFESRVVAAVEDPEVDDPDTLDRRFADIARSVRHQLELMAAVLSHSGLDAARSTYLNALINYNGGPYSIAYGMRVHACFECLQERVDLDEFTMQGDPIRCLNAAIGPQADILADFVEFRALCD